MWEAYEMAASSERKITFGGCALLSSYQLSYSCKRMIYVTVAVMMLRML